MAARPWVTPQEVRDWSERPGVKNRSDERLRVDIARAELWVLNYTRNRFFDDPEAPEPVRIAVLLLAEQYATTAAGGGGSAGGMFKSERFDDYSYTLADSDFLIDNLKLADLLSEFVNADTGAMVMKIRKL